jgi:hypothetical protein
MVIPRLRTDEDAFRTVRWIYIGFMSAMLFYVLLPVELQAVDIELDPKLSDGPLWLLRGGFAALSLVTLLAFDRLFPIPTKARRPSSSWFGNNNPTTHVAIARIVTRAAFAEATGIYGLLIFVMGGHFVDVLAFCAAALAALAWYFPTRDRWDQAVERIARQLAEQAAN